eukprot:TRINITY_DN60085_c0_g1_i1.p1 TRINITY_DN60085_c0_g1~~TRINITY_DN60085_c0_g1_i1.p1  ORF type:complete len:377 (-),score=206.04 TRINITY_DN60085_c0_g1_i1:428-1459(-)
MEAAVRKELEQQELAQRNAANPGSAATQMPVVLVPPEEQRRIFDDELRYVETASRRFHSHEVVGDDKDGFAEPFVTVIVIHHERGMLLLKTMEALLRQEYVNFEIVMVDDGSVKPEALRVVDQVERFFADNAQRTVAGDANKQRLLPTFRLVRQANKYPGAARNLGAQHARGEYILFLDDDDIPRPYWLSTFARVAVRTGADVVTSMFDFFHGDGVPLETDSPSLRWLSVGAAPDLGLWHNVYGAYSALVRRSAFLQIGGFSEEYGTTFEDYEFFSNAVLKGFRLELVPEPLLWYRQNSGKHLMKDTNRYLNRMRALRPYLKKMPPYLRNAIKMAYGIGADKK